MGNPRNTRYGFEGHGGPPTREGDRSLMSENEEDRATERSRIFNSKGANAYSTSSAALAILGTVVATFQMAATWNYTRNVGIDGQICFVGKTAT
jgi:hypothetical protein